MSELGNEFGDKIKAENVNATTPDSVQAVDALGFNNHGLVIRAGDGTVLWSQPDHDVDVKQARQKLIELLK